MSMTAKEWIERFASSTNGAPPSEAETDELLRLASVAAHASERMAAPIACWIAGREGLDPAEAIALAEAIGDPDDGEGPGGGG